MDLSGPLPDDSDRLSELYAYPYGLGPRGVWIRANMASSIDGATAVNGTSKGVSSPADRTVFHVLRSLADVVLVGAGTVRAEGYGPVKRSGDRAPARLAVVSGSLKGLDPAAAMFTEAEQPTLIVTVASADTSAFTELADVVVAGESEVDWPTAIAALRDRGLVRILTEGGPGLLGDLTAADVLDEVCLTVSPVIAGGDSRRVVHGTDVAVAYDLAHALSSDGSLFLRYVRRQG